MCRLYYIGTFFLGLLVLHQTSHKSAGSYTEWEWMTNEGKYEPQLGQGVRWIAGSTTRHTEIHMDVTEVEGEEAAPPSTLISNTDPD